MKSLPYHLFIRFDRTFTENWCSWTFWNPALFARSALLVKQTNTFLKQITERKWFTWLWLLDLNIFLYTVTIWYRYFIWIIILIAKVFVIKFFIRKNLKQIQILEPTIMMNTETCIFSYCEKCIKKNSHNNHSKWPIIFYICQIKDALKNRLSERKY